MPEHKPTADQTARVFTRKGWVPIPLGANNTPASWLDRHPHENIGIVTGAPSDLLVLVIPLHSHSVWRAMTRKRGEPKTVKVVGGNLSLHYYFRHSTASTVATVKDTTLTNTDGTNIRIDVHANRSYVPAPPSKELAGETYRFDTSDASTPADVPHWLLRKLKHAQGKHEETESNDEVDAGLSTLQQWWLGKIHQHLQYNSTHISKQEIFDTYVRETNDDTLSTSLFWRQMRLIADFTDARIKGVRSVRFAPDEKQREAFVNATGTNPQ